TSSAHACPEAVGSSFRKRACRFRSGAHRCQGSAGLAVWAMASLGGSQSSRCAWKSAEFSRLGRFGAPAAKATGIRRRSEWTGSSSSRLEEMAQDLYAVMTQLCLVAPRSRRRAGDLKEIEYLTLAILQERGTMIVGDIQRLLGVLPAQMSRVIRSLEARQWPLIGCRINSNDKRKIDVGLTEAGEKSLLEYQSVHAHKIAGR